MFSSILFVIAGISLIQGQVTDPIISKSYSFSPSSFDEIVHDGSFDVTLQQVNGTIAPEVTIETLTSIQKDVTVKILENHILSLSTKNFLVLQKNIVVTIKFNSPLRRYTVRGTGNVVTDEPGLVNNATEKFMLVHQGTANIALNLDVFQFEGYFSGTGNARVWGQVHDQVLISARGVGDINALNLSTKIAHVLSSGVSVVRVAATEDVRIEVTGVSSVYYRLPAGKVPSKAVSMGLGQIIPLAWNSFEANFLLWKTNSNTINLFLRNHFHEHWILWRAPQTLSRSDCATVEFGYSFGTKFKTLHLCIFLDRAHRAVFLPMEGLTWYSQVFEILIDRQSVYTLLVESFFTDESFARYFQVVTLVEFARTLLDESILERYSFVTSGLQRPIVWSVYV